MYQLGLSWRRFSEEWYWDRLINSVHFKSIYEDTPGSQQLLIYSKARKLSQTAREQCELMGLVTEGLDKEGPGQEVEVCNLKAPRAHLNGLRGRVLSLTGRGAPVVQVTGKRVAVRLADGQELALLKHNTRSPHTASGRRVEASSKPKPQQGLLLQQQEQQSQPQQLSAQRQVKRQRVAELLHIEFEKWQGRAFMSETSLRQANMRSDLIHCVTCGQTAPKYLTLKRTAAPSPVPLPHNAVQLVCLDCFTDEADAANMELTERGAEVYVEQRVMGSMEATMILLGMPTQMWGGRLGSGALY